MTIETMQKAIENVLGVGNTVKNAPWNKAVEAGDDEKIIRGGFIAIQLDAVQRELELELENGKKPKSEPTPQPTT